MDGLAILLYEQNISVKTDTLTACTWCCRHELSLFRTTEFQVESFIANRSCSLSLILNGRYFSRRMQSIPNGCSLPRTDTVFSDRMQDIRGIQAGLYSCAV